MTKETSNLRPEKLSSTEVEHVPQVQLYSVADLVAMNPTVQVFNPAVAPRLIHGFNLKEFDTIKTVRVVANNEELVWIKDGNNRTYAFNEKHKRGDKLVIPPGMKLTTLPPADYSMIPGIDVTDEQFASHGLTIEAWTKDEQPALTVEQFWKVVIIPLMQQSSIVEKRVATHILTGWEALVGKRLSQEVSAFTTLDIFTWKDIIQLINDEEAFLNYCRDVDFTGDPKKDQQVLKAMNEVRKFIVDSQSSPEKVTMLSWQILLNEAKVTSGRTVNHIKATLKNPQVQDKFLAEFQTKARASRATEKVFVTLVEALKKEADINRKGQLLHDALYILEQESLSITDLLTILHSEDWQETSIQVVIAHNVMKVVARAKQLLKSPLTDAESLSIRTIVEKHYSTRLMNENELDMLSANIVRASEILKRSRSLINDFNHPLFKSRLATHPEFIQKLTNGAATLQAAVEKYVADSFQLGHYYVENAAADFEYMMKSAAEAMTQKETAYAVYRRNQDQMKTAGITWNHFLKYAYSFSFGDQAVFAEQLTAVAEALTSLHAGLRKSVLNGEMTLKFALQQQAQIDQQQHRDAINTKHAPQLQEPQTTSKDSSSQPSDSTITHPRNSVSASSAPQSEAEPISKAEQILQKDIVIHEDLPPATERILYGNQQLQEVTHALINRLANIDLKPSEIDPDNTNQSWKAAQALISLVTGRNVDVEQIITNHLEAENERATQNIQKVITDNLDLERSKED